MSDKPPLRVLCLDGGGAKGFYTLGILDEIERNTGRRIHECFDLIYGTSTGAIIAALLARGDSTGDILKIYSAHVPILMRPTTSGLRSKSLNKIAREVFATTAVDDFKTLLAIVSTNWKEEKPFIFKSSNRLAHGSPGSFIPFYGCNVADAIVASCSAHPFFRTHWVTTGKEDHIELADGGFCANNPTLYAIADATLSLGYVHADIRVLSLGVGFYPPPHFLRLLKRLSGGWDVIRHFFSARLLQRMFDTNVGSMEQLRKIMYKDVPTKRISERFSEPEMATDLMEHDLKRLNRLVQKGRISYQDYETEILDLINK
jgi:hypothetical protein